MWFMYGYFDYYLYMLPALLLVLLAQMLVSSRYNQYGKIATNGSITGRQAALYVLQQNGITNVQIQRVNGKMTDHYHPTRKTIYLSDGVYDSTSVAAVSIASHEAGHAVQHAVGYLPLKIRGALVPVCNIASRLGLPLAIIGFALAAVSQQWESFGYLFVNMGLVLFAVATLFQLVTLPVEFNASRRALSFMKGSNTYTSEELQGAKRMLTAAALTYVAALAQSILYLIAILGRRRS